MKIENIYYKINDNGELHLFQRYTDEHPCDIYYALWETQVKPEDEWLVYEDIDKYMSEHDTEGCSVSGSWREIRNELEKYERKYIAAVLSYMNELDCDAETATYYVECKIGAGCEL